MIPTFVFDATTQRWIRGVQDEALRWVYLGGDSLLGAVGIALCMALVVWVVRLIVVDGELKRRVHAMVVREKEAAASEFKGVPREVYRSLKLEGIVEAPINLYVTCDPTRFGAGVIGRYAIRKIDLFSVCCTIESLWLDARAEGEILVIPEPVFPVAYLCVGLAAHQVGPLGDSP